MNWHPLVQRLVDQFDARPVAPESLQTWLDAPGEHALLLSGDPVRFPEALDVAVVLPELRAAFAQRFDIGVAQRSDEEALARRFGVQRWPSVVFLRGSGYLGTVSGMQDWTDYLAAVSRTLEQAPTRAPGVGIPLVAAEGGAGSCH